MSFTITQNTFQKVIYPAIGNVQMAPASVPINVTYLPIGMGEMAPDGTVKVFFETSVPGSNIPGTFEFSFVYKGEGALYKEAESALIDFLVVNNGGVLVEEGS